MDTEITDANVSQYSADTIETLEDIEVNCERVDQMSPDDFVECKTLADNLVVRALAIQAYFATKITAEEDGGVD